MSTHAGDAPSGAAPAPRPRRRAYGWAVLARCTRFEHALADAAARAGGRAEAAAIEAAWPRLYGGPLPPALAGRVPRALEPAFAAGRVRVERRHRHVYYVPVVPPPDDPGLASPLTGARSTTRDLPGRVLAAPDPDVPLPSTMLRVEEAVRRAVEAAGSAVALAAIRAAIAAAPELAIPSPEAIYRALQALVETGRLIVVRPSAVPKREAAGATYYSVPGGPRQVALSHLVDADRRLAAVHAFWRATRGRPFTTTALRRFAAARPAYAFGQEPGWRWSSALHNLANGGDVVRLDVGGSRVPRWAPAAAWERLTPVERDARLHDTHGRAAPADEALPDPSESPLAIPELDGAGEGAADSGVPPHDPAYVSRNADMRALVMTTKVHRASQQPAGRARGIVRARPVSATEVAAVAGARPHLLPEGCALARALGEASRVRARMRAATLTHVGVVGRETFYDVAPLGGRGRHQGGVDGPSASAGAYVAYRRALADAQPARLERVLAALQDAAAYDAAGVISLGSYVLHARASLLLGEAQEQAGAVAAALRDAALLDDEARAAEALRARLTAVAVAASACREHAGAASGGATDEPLPDTGRAVPPLDVAEAERQTRGLFPYRGMASPRQFRTRFTHSVRVVRPGPVLDAAPPDAAPAGDAGDGSGTAPARRRIGRAVEVQFDRVGFAAYTLARFAENAVLNDFVARAAHAMGDLRWAAPFVRTLRDPACKAGHAAAAAALGLLDDAEARAEVAAYLRRALEPGALGPAGPAAGSALASAVPALAPKPVGGVATALTSAERAALGAATAGADPYVAALADRVRRAWDERWSRDQSLAL